MSSIEAARQAATVGELVASVRQFVSTLDKGEAALLDPADPSSHSVSPEHIREAAVRLAQARVMGAPEVSPGQVERMFAFYTEAASRLGHLEWHPDDTMHRG